MVDKVEATRLRESGYGYAEISEALGCSVDWCKRNLKQVKKNSAEKLAIQEAIALAQSLDGITNGQIKRLVQTIYPFEETKEYEATEKRAISRFKAAINKEPNTIIRPYWMQPENAQLSFNLVLQAVDDISQRMNDEVDVIRRTLDLDVSFDNSLRYAIIKMLYGSTLVVEGIENHCDYLNNIVIQLEERNNAAVPDSSRCTLSAPIYYYPSKCAHQNTTCVEKCGEQDGELISLDDS